MLKGGGQTQSVVREDKRLSQTSSSIHLARVLVLYNRNLNRTDVARTDLK